MAQRLIGTAEAAKRSVSQRTIRVLCEEGRIVGAQQIAGVWLLPASFRVAPGARGPRHHGRRKPQRERRDHAVEFAWHYTT
jgi:hypothetical protein